MVSKPRKTKKPDRRELVSRTAQVTSWRSSVYIHAGLRLQVRARESSQYLIIEGKAIDALDGVSDFYLQIPPETVPSVGNREIPSIGAVLQVKPRVEAAAPLAIEEFWSVLSLASSGHLRSCVLTFSKPSYGKALIVSKAFHSDVEEDTELSDPT